MPSRLSRPQSTSETDVTLLVEDDRGQDFLQLLTGKRSSRHLNRQGECQFQASETSIMSLPSLGRAQNFLSNGSCSSQILSERKVRLLELSLDWNTSRITSQRGSRKMVLGSRCGCTWSLLNKHCQESIKGPLHTSHMSHRASLRDRPAVQATANNNDD